MLALAAGDARVVLSPRTGGAIASFDVAGEPVLRPASPEALARGDVLGFASYPLVPYSNRIADATLAAGGESHRLAPNFAGSPHAIHGVGWQRAWTVAQADRRRARLELVHDPARDGADAWPFAFFAWQAFTLAETARGASLVVALGIENHDTRSAPFGLGQHPFFPRDAATRLGFRAAAVWLTDASGIPVRRTSVPGEWRFDPPRAMGGTVVDHGFAGWDGAATLATPGAPFAVRIDADRSLSHLVLYAPPGGDVVALEPVTHMTDAFNRSARGEAGTGARTLPPGGSFSCTIRIAALPVAAAPADG